MKTKVVYVSLRGVSRTGEYGIAELVNKWISENPHRKFITFTPDVMSNTIAHTYLGVWITYQEEVKT